MNWLQSQQSTTGLSAREILLKLIEDSGNKLQVMQAITGTSYQTVQKWFRRHEVIRHNHHDFEYQGIMDSMIGHCRRLGLNPATVETYRWRYGMSRREAVMIYHIAGGKLQGKGRQVVERLTEYRATNGACNAQDNNAR
jgi:hypothetical protein